MLKYKCVAVNWLMFSENRIPWNIGNRTSHNNKTLVIIVLVYFLALKKSFFLSFWRYRIQNMEFFIISIQYISQKTAHTSKIVSKIRWIFFGGLIMFQHCQQLIGVFPFIVKRRTKTNCYSWQLERYLMEQKHIHQ